MVFTPDSRLGPREIDLGALSAPRPELSDAAFEESAFRLLVRQCPGALVSDPSLSRPAQPTTEVPPRGMREPILAQVAPIEDGVDNSEARPRAVPHGHGDAAVQLNDWRRGPP